jgi:hypothetical protein
MSEITTIGLDLDREAGALVSQLTQEQYRNKK